MKNHFIPWIVILSLFGRLTIDPYSKFLRFCFLKLNQGYFNTPRIITSKVHILLNCVDIFIRVFGLPDTWFWLQTHTSLKNFNQLNLLPVLKFSTKEIYENKLKFSENMSKCVIISAPNLLYEYQAYYYHSLEFVWSAETIFLVLQRFDSFCCVKSKTYLVGI